MNVQESSTTGPQSSRTRARRTNLERNFIAGGRSPSNREAGVPSTRPAPETTRSLSSLCSKLKYRCHVVVPIIAPTPSTITASRGYRGAVLVHAYTGFQKLAIQAPALSAVPTLFGARAGHNTSTCTPRWRRGPARRKALSAGVGPSDSIDAQRLDQHLKTTREGSAPIRWGSLTSIVRRPAAAIAGHVPRPRSGFRPGLEPVLGETSLIAAAPGFESAPSWAARWAVRAVPPVGHARRRR